MPPWMNGCQTCYRRLSGAFPHQFRTVCGDGLERLGEDLVPLVWREHGALGWSPSSTESCRTPIYRLPELPRAEHGGVGRRHAGQD